MVTAEKRENERFWVEQTATVRWQEREYSGTTTNISLGGASLMIELDPPPRIGDHVHIHLQVPGIIEPIDMPAIVRWRSGNHFGVQFTTGFRARQTYELSRYLRRGMVGTMSA